EMTERDDLPLSLFEDPPADDTADDTLTADHTPDDPDADLADGRAAAPDHATNPVAHATAHPAVHTERSGRVDRVSPRAAPRPGADQFDGAAEDPPPLTHMIRAAALEAHSATGWVFRNVTFDCRPGALVAVVGPPGSGRSGLLLALTGRLRPTGGQLYVGGYDACGSRRDIADIREQTTLARLGSLIGPEPEFTVAAAVEKRCLLEGVEAEEGRAAFADVCAILEFTVDPDAIIGEL